MAEVAFVAIAKIATTLGGKAMNEFKNKLSEKFTNLRELPENLENVRKDLVMMSNVIQDLDSPNVGTNVAPGWIDELQKVACRVEDVMDEHSFHDVQLQEEGSLTRFFKTAHYAKAFSDVAVKVIEIMKEIQKLKEMQNTWLPVVQIVPKSPVAIDQRGCQGFVPVVVQDEDLVGIKENKSRWIEWLHTNEPNNTVITVSGMGGLGKSTLVANVYDRVKNNSFQVRAWTTVSQTYDIDALLRDLLLKIGYTQITSVSTNKMGTYMLKQEIRSRLQEGSGKCLVVLDDVWDKDVYEKIQDVFKNLPSARVIITTRRDDVASLASMGHHLQLQPLDRDDASRLFFARAFSNTVDQKCPPDLENVARLIVERCRGLPLALVSMGRLMSSKQQTEHAWNQVLNQFRSELSKTDDVGRNIEAILKLSYNELPGNLRNCFLYCSLFPEDYTIPRDNLVRQWVAEGFAVATEKNTPEVVAESNLMELINRNMLQVVDYDELHRVSTCKKHDIVRDLALSTAKKEKFGSANQRGEMINMENDVRRLSTCGWNDSDSSTTDLPCLRTLISIQAVTSTTQMLASIFDCSRYITVLELQDSAITQVPASIQNLFNLRYFGLRRTRVKSLPDCIEKLLSLQTLDIKQTNIVKLPRGITKLRKLRHLLADRVVDERQRSFQNFIGVEAPEDFSNLEELQTLEIVDASDNLGDQLEKMHKLRSVWIGNVNATRILRSFSLAFPRCHLFAACL
jgi:disease resistance protein RPM1